MKLNLRLLFIALFIFNIGVANSGERREIVQSISQDDPMYIVGIELRTTNEKAFEEIPRHWQKFYQESIMDQIKNKISQDIYAVYTNFKNEGKNNEGVYSFVIGARVKTPRQAVPAGLVEVMIPKSQRRVFEVEAGRPEKVGQKWREIWTTNDIQKTFVCDYEYYAESGEIKIFVGVK